MPTAWWPEVAKTFTISVPITLVTRGARGATFGITLTPSLGVHAVQH